MIKNIPLGRPSIGNQEIKNVIQVLQSGWLTHGQFNLQLEDQIKKYFGVKYCILTNSCASALLLSLLALDLPPNGEVLMPSFTFTASANAIVLAGLKPVFCEVELETGNLAPDKLKPNITKKTVAIMPVHFAGQSCHMLAIMKIAKKYKLKVVEDSAECLGGKWGKKYAGTFGDTGCFSFWATKNITTGEGGAVITNNKRLADKIRTLSAHGISSSTLQRERQTKPWLRNATMAGFNMRMSNLQAAVGVAQFKKLNQLNTRRRQLARRLTNKLKDLPQIITPAEQPQAYRVYQMYAIRIQHINRTKFIKKLKQHGIQASVHFDPPVHRQTYYKNMANQSLPITDKLSQTEVTLPLYPDMTFKDIDYLADTINRIITSKLTYTQLKDFKSIYKNQGAYHLNPKGFKAWFLTDNYKAIAKESNTNDIVLDLTCGEGCLGKYLKVKKLIGLDNSQAALKLCQRIFPGVYDDLLFGDLRKLDSLSLPEESFSLIVCSLSLMYLIGSDLNKCLSQIYKLLKPNGRFIFTYPTVGPLRKGSHEAAELHPAVLQDKLKQAGFNINKIKPIVPLIPKQVVKDSLVKAKTKNANKAYIKAKKKMTLESSYHFLGVARK